MMWRVIQE